MSALLQGDIAIVTGSDSGIGQASAIALAREGADVVVTWFGDREGAGRTAEAVRGHGRRALEVRLDVRDPQSVEQLFERAVRELGTPTILVNNAGIDSVSANVKDMRIEDWDRTLRTNLYGPFFCCQQFIRRIEGSGRHGSIVNITSVHQEVPRAGGSAYDVSKGGLRNLTRTLALELAQKDINVNNVAPGMILTPMNQEALDDPQARERQVQSIPMKRAGRPEEIAEAVVFLASPKARYVHGTTLMIDGALTLFLGQGA
ncbi:SDR family NAD(P)-dependent oxidoreductase [Ramlibacter rhizophilus]|uniref:Glucose 1-dehydrogenase n=1 Tax=Ramlibacter rhizophilus TaxID=1781167 RepID=A0A4Z0BK78_9BURK|nr:glucose 1-dehydrogenase [Ramlibacter rhizophilus]TFY98667.1 glucose 1-dehydrogenase [Ramlibacter rhizophilus]